MVVVMIWSSPVVVLKSEVTSPTLRTGGCCMKRGFMDVWVVYFLGGGGRREESEKKHETYYHRKVSKLTTFTCSQWK